MKRFLSLLLAAMMIVALVPAAMADEVAPVTVTMMVSEQSVQPILQDTVTLRTIKEKFGIDLKLMAIPSSDYGTKMSTLFATNDLPDMMAKATMSGISGYELEEMLVNLYDYRDCMPNYFALIEADNRADATKTMTVANEDGTKALYMIQTLEYNRIDIAPIGAIRGDLMEALGLAMPTTWAEMMDTMKAIKAANPDVYFFSSRNGTNYMIGSLAYAMGSGGFGTFDRGRGMYFEKDTGVWQYGPIQPSFKNVVQYLADAYAAGLVDPDYATNTRDALWEKITTGKVVYFKDNNSFIARVFDPAFQAAGNGWYFDIVAPLANDVTTTRELRYERDWSEGTVVSKKCPEIERVLAMMDWCYSDEGVKVMNFGVEGETYYMDEEGHPMMVDSIMEQTAGSTDQFNAIQSILGVGCYCWTPYIDEGTYLQTSGKLFLEMGEEIRGYTEAGLIDFKAVVPAMTAEELEEVADIELDLQTVFDAKIDSFITGATSMTEWDAFVADLKKCDIERLEEIFNTAYNR